MNKYSKLSNKLILFLLESNKAPFFREYTNLVNNKSFGNIMVEDLGDSMPFLYWTGQKLNLKYSEIADNTSKFFIKKFQNSNGFFSTSSKFNVCNFDKMTDLSLGLNLMYVLTEDIHYLNSSKKFFDAFSKFTSKNNGFIPYIYFDKIGFSLNFSTGKFGLYVEELCNLYNFTNDYKYIRTGKQIIDFWLNNIFYKNYGVFPFAVKQNFLRLPFDIMLKKKIGFGLNNAMSSKANTSLLQGMCKLYNVTGDFGLYENILKWCRSVHNNLLCYDGSLYSIWGGNGHNKFLGCDHAIIDSFLEVYLIKKDRWLLNDAVRMADFWLTQQDESGLIQQGVNGFGVCVDKSLKYGKNPNYFRLDPQVDFFVMLIKLYQLTNKKYFLDSALKLLNGICKYHSYNSAFVDVIDEKKNKLDFFIETKFLFLILKALMFESYKDKSRIYKDNKLRLLLRDR